MSHNSDQLAILGQKVIDALIATYNPANDPSIALALHPGQALADDIVQNGVTNPLRLSEWLEDQYDYPLWLKRSDASSISTASVGAVSAKSTYLAMVPWAQPSVPADSPAYARLAALIAGARRDLGDNPNALPFSCEPTDFAQADSTAWHVFDQRITASSSTTTTSSPVRANPQLWKMRRVTDDFLSTLPSTVEIAERRRAFAAELAVEPRTEVVRRLRTMPNPDELAAQPIELMRVASSSPSAPEPVALRAIGAANLRAATVRPVTRSLVFNRRHLMNMEEPPFVVEGHTGEAAPVRIFDRRMLDRLSAVQLHDLVQTPAVTEVTTSDSELHVHFEYCLVTITRRLAGTPWWRSDLILEDDWYVPGMRRGDMVKPSTDEAYAHCLPQGLLLVRNVRFSGSWTAEARATMENPVSFLGPFLLQAPRTEAVSTSDVEQVSVLGIGTQVIGELCFPLPPLPPADDPALAVAPAG
ncbi:hypothetical protein [Rhizobium sp. YS-1r]|uniref:hypothetical protein n=1 Tax=Rhizobium sp. YS-1r TaxID=1532558 RepID=UPI00050EE286|nr:hypothetical protein [Rhizobium sp. YS-1r]KGE02515.1 hypothetical protein JL39_03035 [Rhizobium sp. YS-1r]